MATRNLADALTVATTAQKGVVQLATDGESSASKAVAANDARLSDARTPTSHTHTEAEITDLGAYMENPMTTADDVIIGGVSGAPTRLAKGANNTVLGVDGSGVLGYKADPAGGSGHTIEDEGTPLTARGSLNFVGAGVAVTDDAANDATVVTIAGGGGGALDDLSDVDLTTIAPAAGDRLIYDGTNWVPSGAALSLLLQLDAGAGITMDGSNLVSDWESQGVNEANTRQPTATNQPLWVDSVINGEPVVRFDGVDNYMLTPINANQHSTFTIAAVLRPRSAGTTKGMVSWSSSVLNAGPFFILQREGTDVKVYVNSGFRWTIAHATDATKLYVCTFDGFQWDLYVDGVAQASYVGADANRSSALYVFLGVGYNGYANVEIPALEVYDRVLSTANRNTMTTRLKTKYGIA